MWARRRAAAMVLVVAIVVAGTGCGRAFRQYEYEEEIFLRLDGSADIVVNASIPALVALTGVDLSADYRAALDRDKLRTFFRSPSTQVTRVSRSWRRSGRRFIQVRVRTGDIRSLGRAPSFASSVYRLDARDGLYVYRQTVAAPQGRAVANAGWNGSEIVAVRMHVPSKIQYHNAPSREVEPGNIVGWEQPLSDRLAGKPLEIEVRMETESILARTLLVFGASAAAALTLFATVIFWVRRSGRRVA